ncbi:MAG: hypothetical protein MZV65_29615 [Chromatiales bacterium]|nr:hypothetical protein [Chromatiales bacterium]
MYFAFFLLMPWYTTFDKTKPVPERVTLMNKTFLAVLFALLPGVSLAAGSEHVKLDPREDRPRRPGRRCSAARACFVNYCLSTATRPAYMRYGRMAERPRHSRGSAGEEPGVHRGRQGRDQARQPDEGGDAGRHRARRVQYRAAGPGAGGALAQPELVLHLYARLLPRRQARHRLAGIVFPGVAMPHVLHDLQGQQRAVYQTVKHEAKVVEGGKKAKKVSEEKVFDRFEIEKAGSMNAEQYDAAMRDLTNFMVYLGEPAKLVRYRIGIVVLVFLAIFLVIAYLLKKEILEGRALNRGILAEGVP